ncbi:MAG: tetratricopeptide repeat protein [Spirochaetaceae bacterium]|nr:MAG: tetratricopeptide repeat protein [Spirochaetaceae bacterium]
MKKVHLILVVLFLASAASLSAATETELYSEAEGYYRAGNFLLALDTYGEFIRTFPLSDRVADAQYRRGVSLFRLGRFREALGVFEEIERRYRSARFFEYIYFWRGVAYFRLESFAQAEQALGVFLQNVDDQELTPQAFLYKAQAEIALQDFGGASADLEALIEGYPSSESAQYGLVLLMYAYLPQGRYQEIEELSGSSRREGLSEDRRALFDLYTAEALWNDNRTEEAEAIFDRLRSAQQQVASVAYRRLFMAAAQRGELSRMEALVREAESQFAGAPEVLEDLWIQVGVESFQQAKFDLSEYFLSKVWSLPKKSDIPETVPLYLAELSVREGNLNQAAAVLEQYLSANPKTADLTQLKLGDVRLLQGDYVTAEQIYSKYLKDHPDSATYSEALYLLAYAQFRKGDLVSALALAEDQLPRITDPALRPLRADWYKLAVVLYRRRGELTQAVERLREYVDLYPQDLKARIDLLKLLFSLKDYGAIVSETNRLRQEFPDLASRDTYVHLLSNYLRGLSEISRKRYDSALEALNQVSKEEAGRVGLNAIWPYTLYYQGWAFYRSGKYEAARDRVTVLLESEPSHPLFPQALFLAGWASFSMADYRSSSQYFARLAKMNTPESDKSAFLQARSLMNLRDLDTAAILLKTHYTTRPNSAFADDALFEYAGIQADLGKTTEAADAFSRLAANYPQSPLAEESLYKRGEVYSAGGQFLQAKDAFYEYRTRFPRGKLVDAALYWGGLASYELGEKFGAVLHWERLLDNFPLSPFRPDALRRTAEIYAERGDRKKAIELYTLLSDAYPDEAAVYNVTQRIDQLRYLMQGLSDREAVLSSIIGVEGGARTAKGREAMIELSRLYIYEGSRRMDLALEMLLKVVDQGEPVTASQAQFLIGEYYYRKSNPLQAAREFLKAGYLNPDDPDQMAASIFRAAEMMQLAGNFTDVRELVGRLEQHFPDSQWTEEAKKLLEGGRR